MISKLFRSRFVSSEDNDEKKLLVNCHLTNKTNKLFRVKGKEREKEKIKGKR